MCSQDIQHKECSHSPSAKNCGPTQQLREWAMEAGLACSGRLVV